MKLWISGEVHADVAQAWRDARKDVEQKLAPAFSGTEATGLSELALIGIVLPEPSYKEVKRYSASGREAEFRLYIDHEQFMSADGEHQRGLVCDAIVRAVRSLPELGARTVDVNALVGEVETVAAREGWPLPAARD